VDVVIVTIAMVDGRENVERFSIVGDETTAVMCFVVRSVRMDLSVGMLNGTILVVVLPSKNKVRKIRWIHKRARMMHIMIHDDKKS